MQKPIVFLVYSFIICFLLQSCYEIDDNRRVLVTGRTVDDTGHSLQGILIESRGGGRLLGTSVSDAEGNFSFTSLESNAQDFTILLNPEPANDTIYTSVAYRNNPQASTDERIESGREQNLYDLGTVPLRTLAYLDVEIKRTSNTQDTLYYDLQTTEALCEQFYTNDQLDTERANCFEQKAGSGSFFPEETSIQISSRTVQRDTAILSYRFNNQEPQAVKIPIDQYNTNYVFEF